MLDCFQRNDTDMRIISLHSPVPYRFCTCFYPQLLRHPSISQDADVITFLQISDNFVPVKVRNGEQPKPTLRKCLR